MMLPMGMAYIGQAAPKGKEGRFVAIYNTFVLLASGMGPFISIIIAGFNHHRNYRATFATLFVLSVIAFLILPLSRNGQKKQAGGYNGVNDNINGNASSAGLKKNQHLMALSAANIALAVVSE
jgi:DHA1 family multidrug resistance protein-like MFS transporter